jgi:osmoprotectant transport system ATP-binding protein
VHEPAIEYRDVSVVAAGRAILDRVTLTIARHERIVYLGRSGAGKTTALRVINGLVQPTDGEVAIEGTPLARHDLVALRRRIGYVMQQPALFPHRTVYENVATVPRLLGWDEARTRERAEGLLRMLELEPARFGERFPGGLSGGEQQRVAIARALIAEPAILLCDEPFAALDPLLRAELQSLLMAAARTTTLVFVTHDVREAMRIGQRIVVFDAGRVVADTTPGALATHDHPLVRRFAASVS